ncbi:MAG TPA: M48 family metalloprotease [Reyranella sp.]|nr:M48 family metalloprotease [Reyranella sp.]
MIFRSLFALLALVLLAGGCASGIQPAATAVPSVQGDTLPTDVEQLVGPLYRAPELQAMVDRVGQRLVSRSALSGSYRFYVLDQPVPNAHAIPTGYVFVTRGLLAVMDDEAELAAAMGHELGHVIERHAAQRERERRSVMDAAVDAAMKSGSISVGRSVARDGLMKLRRYSRDQELEADRAGVGYLIKAGYRADAMVSLIEKLRRQSQLEEQLIGRGSATESSVLSTHPGADDRLVALRGLAGVGTAGESGRAGYLAAIDGMSVDDAPEEGFIRGPSFMHPVMRIAFTAPRDFRLYNDHEGVLGVGADRSLLYFSCKAGNVAGPIDDWMRNRLQPTPTDIQSTEIGGAEAAIGSRPRGSDTGLNQVRYVIIRRPDGICYFNLMSEGPDRDRRIVTLVESTRSFHDLSPAQAAALRPYRLQVVPRNASAAAMAARIAYPDLKLERLLVLNGVDDAAAFARLDQVKLVE